MSDAVRKTAKSRPAESIAEKAATIRLATKKIQTDTMTKVGKAAKKAERIDSRLTKPFKRAFRLVKPFFVFIQKWFASRRYNQLVYGVPAILLIFPMAYCMVRIPLNGANSKTKHYRRSAHAALSRDDRETADLLFRKINQLQRRPNEQIVFQSAVNLDQQGKTQEAIERMQTIASLEHPGFALGHIWLASKILPDAIKRQDPTAIKNAEEHLKIAIDIQPKMVEASIFLAEVYLRQGDLNKAREIAERHRGNQRIHNKIHLATLFLMLNDIETCKALAGEVAGRIAQKFAAISDPTDLPLYEYLDWVTASELQFDFDKMEEILAYARKAFPDDGALKKKALRLSRIQLYKLRDSDPSKERIQVVKDMLAIEPENRRAVNDLHFMALYGNEETSKSAIETLENQADNSLEALDAMATIAISKKDLSSARQHFQAIIDRDANNANALNNLAWILAHDKPIDLSKAIELVDLAIKLVPNDPNYRDTKGHILNEQEKWQEAITELDLALNGLPNSKATHLAIAIAYEQLRRFELAESHRNLAALLP